MFDLVTTKAAIPSVGREERKRVTLTRDQVFEKYKRLYYEFLDTISLQITTRFQDFEKLHFITLMDRSKFEAYSEKFPTTAMNNLKECYPNLFTDLQRLKNELQHIYSDEEYRNMEQDDFMKGLSEIRDIFKEAYTLFCLILTLPSTSVSVERSFSCLKRIKTYLRNSITKERLNSLSKVAIEKELLKELIDDRPFYEDIIDKFAALKERRIDLISKKLNLGSVYFLHVYLRLIRITLFAKVPSQHLFETYSIYSLFLLVEIQ